jgi:hypothetical protein
MPAKAWPVIDNRVRVFKHEGGTVDEKFEAVALGVDDTVAYCRDEDRRLYLFLKVRGGMHRTTGRWFSAPDTAEGRAWLRGLPVALRSVADAAMVVDLVWMDPPSFYMDGGSVTGTTGVRLSGETGRVKEVPPAPVSGV